MIKIESNANDKKAEEARQEYFDARREFVNKILKDKKLNNVAIDSLLNKVIGKYDKSEQYATNSYCEDFTYKSFFSRTCLGKSFNSAREAKLYDAISEFFDNKRSSSEIEFLVDFINSYNSK